MWFTSENYLVLTLTLNLDKKYMTNRKITGIYLEFNYQVNLNIAEINNVELVKSDFNISEM